MGGFAGAFREHSVIAAIAATGGSGIPVSMIQWSENRRQEVAVDWQVLTDEHSVADFATALDHTPRLLDGDGNATGGAIALSLAEPVRNGHTRRAKARTNPRGR